MKPENIMTEKDSMELITSMINKAKNNFTERGLLYLIWGWVILGCCLISFVGSYYLHNPKVQWVWMAVYLVLIFQVIYIRRNRKHRRTRTYTGEINGYVWLVFMIALFLMIFICISFQTYQLIDPLLLVLYGVPTFLTGMVIKFRPLWVGAICCWILALMSPFIPSDFVVLEIGLAVVAAWITPGYLLSKRFNKQRGAVTA